MDYKYGPHNQRYTGTKEEWEERSKTIVKWNKSPTVKCPIVD